LNRVILIGRLTREPELRFTASGTAVANFTLAVDRPFLNAQGKRDADFIRIVTWGKLAENCSNYLGKGRLVAIDGKIQVRSYQTSDGQTRIITEVVAEKVQFLEYAKNGNGHGEPKGEAYEPEPGGPEGPEEDSMIDDGFYGDEEPPF
jgi:single-strand DNA-binding protein